MRPRSRMSTAAASAKPDQPIPPVGNNIRIIPLGGVEEIGRNMTCVEIGDDIYVVDCGFQFKEIETPGIDYILPNTQYLEDNQHKIRALFITHGHLDHIGGIPFIIDRIGNPPIYTRKLTAIMVKKRQFEFPHLPELDIRVVEKNEKLRIGNHSVRFFGVTHTIPDSMGIIIDTLHGGIVMPGDFKLEHVEGIPSEREEKEYAMFDNENVLLLMLDSTNVENPGFSTPEKYVHENLEKFIKDAKGRLIIGTFASQMERMIKIIEAAEKYKKKIVIMGRSMKQNIEIAKEAGLLKVKPDTIIPPTDVSAYAKSKIVCLATGAQGEEFAGLMRMANKSDKFMRIEPGDTVLLSASIIPGNERSVERLKDNIARQGGKIISYRTSDVYVHSTGHGNRGELEWLHRKIKPKFFVPVHGNHYRLRTHAELAKECGLSDEHVIVPDNSSIIEVQEDGSKLVMLPVKAPSVIRMVDGLSIGDIQEVVMKDRQALAEDGMFVIIAMVNVRTGRLKKSPDIISRGFIYLRESQDLLQETRVLAKKAIEDLTKNANPINFDLVRKQLGESISAFLFQKTQKHPIVIPVLLGV
jgi:ribonuclease J